MTTKEITKARVQLQIRNWKNQIKSLYADIQEWLLDTEYRISIEDNKITMLEENMKINDIKSIKLPYVKIYKGEQFIATIKPEGLWFPGINGKISFDTFLRSYTIINISSKDKAQWKVLVRDNFDFKRKNLSKTYFLNLLKNNQLNKPV